MRVDSAKLWESKIKAALSGSPFLLRDVWRGVYGIEKKKQRPKVVSKSIAGEPLGKKHLAAHVIESIARAQANKTVGVLADKVFVGKLNLSAPDEEIRDWCENMAAYCERRVEKSPMPAWEVREILREHGLDLPVVQCAGDSALMQAVKRACNSSWWRRRVRAMKMRFCDEFVRGLGMVGASGQVYCSDELLRLRRGQNSRNRSVLEGMEATNNYGEKFVLSELADVSTSNPRIRRSELMVRMHGFEAVANDLGHQGMFITLTCPSAYHPTRQIKSKGKLVRVVKNESWAGFSVREAQEWLNKIWCRIRAAWNYRGIRPYGFRVAEPHADGSPHWHFLLFFEPDQVENAMHIVKDRALAEYGDERGAQKYRVKIVEIDKNRGSATGYIAKYIAKNIDGSHLENDLFGNDARDAAERICATMAGHGIRQFQQIGGPSVQVWRELRRMDDADGIVEFAREAATNSDWETYISVMGGPTVKRADQPIRLARWIEMEWQGDEVDGCYVDIDKTHNIYGEETPGKIFGLCAFGKNYLTRIYRWVVERIGKSFRKISVDERLQKKILYGLDYWLPATNMDDDLMLDLLRGAG